MVLTSPTDDSSFIHSEIYPFSKFTLFHVQRTIPESIPKEGYKRSFHRLSYVVTETNTN